jgi:DNA-binding XRE family transcriptional regulator
MSKLSSFYGTIQKNIEKIPSGKLKNYVLSKLPNLQLLKNILNKVLKTSSNIISKTPKKFRKAIVAGLITYITAEGLDRLLHRKVGTTREEMASPEGISDETMAKIEKLGNIAVPSEEIKTADDLGILVKKQDLKTFTIKIIELYKDRYPCLGSLYQKNQFTVIAATEEKDIFKINGVEYYGYGAGIFDTKTNQEWEC